MLFLDLWILVKKQLESDKIIWQAVEWRQALRSICRYYVTCL